MRIRPLTALPLCHSPLHLLVPENGRLPEFLLCEHVVRPHSDQLIPHGVEVVALPPHHVDRPHAQLLGDLDDGLREWERFLCISPKKYDCSFSKLPELLTIVDLVD